MTRLLIIDVALLLAGDGMRFASSTGKEVAMTIYEALKKDHDEMKELLGELVMIEDHDEEDRELLLNKIRDELIPHSRAEESVFYNSLRLLDAAKDIVMHRYQEHMEAEALLRKLEARRDIDQEWTETAKQLKKAVEQHIEEEEGRVFAVAQELFTREEAFMMGEAFEQLKPEVKTEGFVQTTMDLVSNLMPPRFAASLRSFDLNPHL